MRTGFRICFEVTEIYCDYVWQISTQSIPVFNPNIDRTVAKLQVFDILYTTGFELPFFSSKTCPVWAIASVCHNHITWCHKQDKPIICSLNTMSNITHCYLRQVCTSLPYYLFYEVDFAAKINSHSHYCPDCTVHPYRKKTGIKKKLFDNLIVFGNKDVSSYIV